MILPTKNNVLKMKKTIQLAKQGQELLEKKKYVLWQEREKQQKEYQEKIKRYEENRNQAFYHLRQANVRIGINRIKQIADEIPLETSLDIKYKTIMGVEIPSIIQEIKQKNDIPYGLYHTTMAVDEAIQEFSRLREQIIELAQKQNAINRLNEAIRGVQTRANSLKEIIIPEDERIQKQLEEIIEEQEREEFIRLKVVKKAKGN